MPLRLLAPILLLAGSCWAATAPAQIAHSVTIYRDTYGVPHVWGPTDR